jgi:hypothetical protein
VYNIALIGKARSGKDTAAAFLVRERAYTRIAFADPLKEMALSIDPLIPAGRVIGQRLHVRLSALVNDVGWEYAKDYYPEVRAMLQRIGQTQREFDADYWVRVASRKIAGAERWNLPVVVTDVRYQNEADMLRARGFRMVRIIRPLAHMANPNHQYGKHAAMVVHTSETELDNYPTDAVIYNDKDVATLQRAILF